MVMGELSVETELLVIGGGPGGYAAAFRAADLGLDVTLVEAEPRLGGVCLLRGCIPSKALLSAAEIVQRAREGSELGLTFGDPQIDLGRLRGWKEDIVGRLSGGLDRIAKQRGVQRVRGWARFDGSHKVRLEHSDIAGIRFKHAIIATGSTSNALPGLPFRPGGRVMDSDGALALADVPERLLVIGGGYVGLEMGTVYAALGSRVTVVQRGDRLLPTADPDLVRPLARLAAKRFEAVHLNSRVSDVREDDTGVTVNLEGEARQENARFDRVLVAIGRRPLLDDLNLESTGVTRGKHGAVEVDAQRRSREPALYAIGDAAGGIMLAHKAMAEGKVAAEAIAGKPAAFEPQAIPAVVYTDPQIAWCGLTEQEAQQRQIPVKVARFPWGATGRALTENAGNGMTKLVCDPDTGRVLGVGIVGRHAESLITEGVLAVEMGALAEDLALSIHPHPSLSETLGEAAEAFLGRATHYVSPQDNR